MAFGDLLGSDTGIKDGTGTSISVDTGFTVSAGNLVVIGYHHPAGSSADSAASDGLGNTYTQINSSAGAALIEGSFWYSIIDNAGTCIPSLTIASANNVKGIHAACFEGPFAASPLDVDSTATEDNTSPHSFPATGTLAQADEIILAFGAYARDIGDISSTSPFTEITDLLTGVTIGARKGSLAYNVVSSTSTVTPQQTSSSGSTNSTLYTCSFMKAATVTRPGSFSRLYRSKLTSSALAGVNR